MDPELLARIQFALTAGFHFLFPPLSIGLGVFLVVAQGFALKTKDPVWRALADFWTKIFALVFAFGVATGIVLAAGLLVLALAACIFIGLVMLLVTNTHAWDRPYLLVVRIAGETADQAEGAVKAKLDGCARANALKAKNVIGAGDGPATLELTYELRLKDAETSFTEAICAVEGVTDATLVSYNGDYLG